MNIDCEMWNLDVFKKYKRIQIDQKYIWFCHPVINIYQIDTFKGTVMQIIW